MKTCTMCNKTKPLEKFAKHKKSPDGKTSRCLVCRRIEYKRWKQKVDKIGHKLSLTDSERFYGFIKTPENRDSCWIWLGGKTKAGYGRFTVNAKQIYAHRYSYKIHKGIIPDGKLVLHKCDEPSCCNPKHLFLGTHQDNSNDMKRKLRQAIHSKNSHAKLTEEDVLFIRNKGLKYSSKVLSDYYNVSPNTIYQVRTRLTWKYI